MAKLKTPVEIQQKEIVLSQTLNVAAAYGSSAHSYVLGAMDALRWMQGIPPATTIDLCEFSVEQPAQPSQPATRPKPEPASV
jgi:hypothetical protein